jgi:hypothetical protein
MSLVETFNTSLRKCLDGIGRYKRNGGSNYDSLKISTLREIVGCWLKQPTLCLLVDQTIIFNAGVWRQDHLVRGRPMIEI